MHKVVIVAVAFAVLPLPALSDDKGLAAGDQWPQWRGPLGTGVAPSGDPPIEWSEDKNVHWKIAIPGKGHSTPIIWGDRVFITSAVPSGDVLAPRGRHAPGAHDNVPASRSQKFVVLAVDRRDGTVLWQRTVRSDHPHEAENGHPCGR